jgi:hypothetical protein
MPHDTVATVYPTDATGEDVRRVGKDLFLQVDVGETAAKVRCHLEEKVGDHEDRKVIFEANKACTLKFNCSKVFGKPERTIMEGRTEIEVVVPPGETAWTFCEVLPLGGSYVLPTKHDSPPKLIVP